MRTGSEPVTARSALRLRFWLSVWGFLWAAAGTAAFSLTGHPGWAAAFGALLVIVTVDLSMIVHHIHQGAHYQPGRDVPPYEPVHGRNQPRPRPPAGPHRA
ncbi:DUF6343 family protein [Streptomyces sp. NPDC005953]|uniref:DUF6343 family protein n=1 Tax=unclassified Streptomyces TaxID=2593676 RepID=UPI0033EC1BB0